MLSTLKYSLRVNKFQLQSMIQKFSTTQKELFPRFPFKRPFGAEPPVEFVKLRRSSPVSKVSIVDDNTWAWLLTSHADICKVLSDNDNFSKIRTRPNFPELTAGGRIAAQSGVPTFVDMDPPQHTAQRAMVEPTVCPRQTLSHIPMIQEMADKQIQTMMKSTEPSVDLVASFALPFASGVIYRILGIPTKDMDFLSECNAVRTSGSSTATQASGAATELVDYLKKLIEFKLANPDGEKNLINNLINEQLKPKNIELDNLVQMVFLMLVAGNATMVSMIALGVSTFLQHPAQLVQLKADPSLYKNACEELCRFHTASALATRRVAIKDITINGTLIKAGDGVIAATQSGNRDENAFPNPDAFDIHRKFDMKTHKSLAYGHGVHQCVAEWLAMAELEVSLRSLFAAMPKLRLAVDPKDIKYSPLEGDVGIVELPVSWK